MSEPHDAHGGSVLVVDDNEMNRDMLSRRMTRQGHRVVVAEDGHRALQLVEEQPFDLILLDVMMPGIDGFQTLSRLRQKYAATDLPVIMATAKDQSADIVNALKMGANDYVTKPLDFAVVLARVQTQLELKRSVDRIRQLEANLTRRNAELEEANERMKRDLDAAAKVQQSGLPTTLPQIDGYAFAWAYHPCDELGGDSLNIFPLDERHVGIYVLDVSGHGVPAALLSVSLNRELTPRRDSSSLVIETIDAPPGYAITPPAVLAGKLNRNYQMDMDTRQFFTVLYGVLDVRSRLFRFVGAGHPGPVRVPRGDGRATVHNEPGFPVGIVEEADYQETTVQLEPGDRLFLYSDGLIEQKNDEGDAFGTDRLADLVGGSRGDHLKASVDGLLQNVIQWAGAGRVRDDLSIAALEVS